MNTAHAAPRSTRPAGEGAPGPDEIAIVVLSVGAPAVLVEALQSLLTQDVVPEIVVVNSGGGDARGLLARHGLEMKVVEFDEVLFPGAARNAGIAATTAPIVGFLACDCLAEPGWVANRLARHRAGHAAVASAVTNSHPRSLVAWAAHVCTYALRLPQLDEERAIRYGASYERDLFERHGCFREDLRTGEDSEFHNRMRATAIPVWAPEIRTAHRNPTSIPALIKDQFSRGHYAGKAHCELFGALMNDVLKKRFHSIIRGHRIARQITEGTDRRCVMIAWPIVMVGLIAHIAGIITYFRRHK